MSAGRRSIVRRMRSGPPDDVVIVDWSSAATRKTGSDSIWISHVEVGEHAHPCEIMVLVRHPFVSRNL